MPFLRGRTDMIGDINSPTMTRRQSSSPLDATDNHNPGLAGHQVRPFPSRQSHAPRMIEFRFQDEQEGVDWCCGQAVWISEFGPACSRSPHLWRFPRLLFPHLRSHRPSGSGLVSRPTREPPRDKIKTVRTTAAYASPPSGRMMPVCAGIPTLPLSASNLQPSTCSPQHPASNCPTTRHHRQFQAPSRARTNKSLEHGSFRFIAVLPPLPRPTARDPRLTALLAPPH